MTGELLYGIVAGVWGAVGPLPLPPGITAEIRFVFPRSFLVNDCFGMARNAVQREF